MAVKRAGWIRLSPPGHKLVAHWELGAELAQGVLFGRRTAEVFSLEAPPARVGALGWSVRHCGHPTAIWPYFADHPEIDGLVVEQDGRGFRTLEKAFTAIEAALFGDRVIAESLPSKHGRTFRIVTRKQRDDLARAIHREVTRGRRS